MAKGLLGGMTDYSHQSFSDILNDLNEEKRRTIGFREAILENKAKLEAKSYWSRVPSDFKSMVAYALRHYGTAIEEFEDIEKGIQVEVEDHHVRRLRKIAEVAQKINVDIGQIWHQKYDDKDYEDPDFRIVEQIYCDSRDMAVNLLDTANISERLMDFRGRRKLIPMKNNPWLSGSFYMVLMVVVLVGLAALSNMVAWVLVPLVVIGGFVIIVAVGLLQLKNDDRIDQKTFRILVIETLSRLPLIGWRR